MMTLVELFGLLGDLWRTGNWWMRRVVFLLLAWPFVVLLVALTLSPTVVASIATTIPVLSILLLLFSWPVATAIAASARHGRHVIGALLLIAAGELVVGIYLVLVPVRNAPEMIPIFILVAFATLFLTAGASLLGRTGEATRRLATILVLIAVGITAIFFAGGVDEARTWLDEQAAASASSGGDSGRQAVAAQRVTQVSLLGENLCSESVNLDNGPRGKNLFEGPAEARVHWQDGTTGFITEWFDVKGGHVCFTGPAGEKVTVRQVPRGA